MLRIALFLILMFGLLACAPSDGPSVGEVRREARAADVPILGLTPDVITALGNPSAPANLSSFGARPYTPGEIMAGDVIAVRVFETNESGVFSIADAASLDLGEFVVSQSGSVAIPFVGSIRVAGNSVAGAQRVITERLRQTSLEPHATVNIQVSPNSSFTVQGAVRQGGVFSLTARGERILDAVAMAGGAEGDPDSTLITLRRGSTSRSATYANLLADSSQNVAIRPSDTVIVGQGEARFIADGAVNSPGEFTFVEGALSFAQAIAQAGGLQDARANPRAVFLFRRQSDGEFFRLRQDDDTIRDVYGDVIFQARFDDPLERLNAQDFYLRDGDVVYVGNAPLAEFSRFFQVFNSPPEVPAPPTR